MAPDITGWVQDQRDELLSFLEQVVNMDSPSDHKDLVDAAGSVFADRCREIGLGVTFDRQAEFGDNVVARIGDPDTTDHRPRALMVGHMDTVYGRDTARERPFRITDGYAYGPGIHDMKGGLAIGLFALEAAMKHASRWRSAVTFIFNSDEEPGSPRSRKLITAESKRHDLALILEPGRPGPALTLGRKGVGVFRLSVEGVAAHAGAEPERGVNTIIDLAHRVLAVAQLADPNATGSAGTTVTPGVITGGTEPYVVPDHADLRIDIRVPTLTEQQRVLDGLDRVVRSEVVAGATASLEGGFHRPPMEPTEETHRYAKYLQTIAAEEGFPLSASASGGASDGNLTAALIPTLDGLGTHGGRAHSPEEYIEIHSLFAKCAVLANFLLSLNADGLARP